MRKNLKYLIISLFALLVFSCGMILISHDFSVNNNGTQEEEEVEDVNVEANTGNMSAYIKLSGDADTVATVGVMSAKHWRPDGIVWHWYDEFTISMYKGYYLKNFTFGYRYYNDFSFTISQSSYSSTPSISTEHSHNNSVSVEDKTDDDTTSYGLVYFVGCSDKNNYNENSTGFTSSTYTVTLGNEVAGWEYTISYVSYDSLGTYQPTSATCGQGVRISNPIKTGYSFNGWTGYSNVNSVTAEIGGGQVGYSNKRLYSKWNDVSVPTTCEYFRNLTPNKNSVILYADWTANTYNIIYNLDGGTAGSNSPTTGTYASVVNISYPTREGYTFTGWTYSGGNSSTAQYSNRKGGLIFTYDIYDDWTDGTETIKATKFKNLTPTNNATVTLTAHWVKNDYNITFYSNKPANMTSGITQTLDGSAYTSTSKTMSNFVTFDSSVSKTAKASATGWTFNGYYTSASDGQKIFDGNGNIVKNVSGYTDSNGKWKKAANTSLYAQWTANGYKPLIKPNGGIYNGSGNNLELSGITYDNAFNVLNPTREGYTFAGWTMTNGDANTALYGASSDSLSSWSDPSTAVTSTWFNNLTPTKNATVTLTAQWTANEYHITFDANKPASMTSNITQTLNGNAYTSTPTTMSKFVTFDSSVSKTAKASATGWAFNGYYTSASGGQRIFDGNGNIVKNVSGYTDSNGNWKKAANTSLYARWAQRVYAITLNKQSGSDGTSTIYQKYDNGYYLNYANNVVSNQMTNSANPITVPTRNGYVFDGYYLNTAFNTAEQYIDCYGYLTTYAANNHFAAAGTLYAKWIGTWAQFQSFWAPTQNSSGQYQIASAANLAWFMNKVNFNNASGDTLHAIQTNNIDLSGHIWYPIGTSSSKFYGTYDGQGYKISGLETVAQVNGGVAGLFGFISNKTATSVEIETKITNVYIEGGNVNGHVSVGGVVGNIASGLVSKCLVYNTTINGGARGGIVGVAASGSKIDNSIYYNANAISLTHNICSGSGTITDCLSKINGTETFYGKNDDNWRNVTNMFVSALPKALFWIAYTE